jgi:hypothetical protein
MSIETLTAFDKLNIAVCAVNRANQALFDDRRFSDEYDTAMLWKGHRLSQTTLPTAGLYHYATVA